MKYRTKDGRFGYSGTDWKPEKKDKYERYLQHCKRDRKAIELTVGCPRLGEKVYERL